MALDASAMLGASQLAGATVSNRGFVAAESMRNTPAAGPIAGAVGAAAQTYIERHQKGKAAQTPAFKGSAFIAVTESEIALIQLKSVLVSRKLDRVLARRARAEVASAQLAEAKTVSPLTIAFTDDSSWEFDVPLIAKSAAREVVRSLTA